MKTDFNFFINGIKDKTGIDVSVYSEFGEYISGKINVQLSNAYKDGFSVDKKNGITVFPVKYKSKNYLCAIEGTTDTEKNYALLISEIAKGVSDKDSDFLREEFFSAILSGELGYSEIQKYALKFSVPEVPCFVAIVFLSKGDIGDVKNIILSYGDDKYDCVVPIDERRFAFVKFLDATSEEYRSSKEYAEFLARSVYDENGVSVGVFVGGTVKNFYLLNSSYSQALSASEMIKTVKDGGEVHSFKECMLVKMLEDLPKYKLKEYLDVLTDSGSKEIFENEEMTTTAEMFLDNNLNISETSRVMYLHRNTLLYRLDKIEKVTGLNVRNFSDAVTFKLIILLYKLTK